MPNNDRLLLPSPPQASLPLERKLAVDPAVLARSGIVSEDELVRTGVKPILVAARASGERTPASLRRGRHAAGVLSRDEAVHPAHRRASPAPASPSVASTSPDPRLPVHLLEDSVPSRPRGLDEDAPRDSRDSSAARESDESRPRSLRGGGREVVGRDRLPSSREVVDAFTARSALETNTVRRLRVRFETNASSNLFPGGGVDDATSSPGSVSLPSARAAESDDARERRVALANFEASRRRDEPDARGRVRRILGRLWKGSALGTFHAWREFARGRRHGRDAAAFAAETLSPILATRPRARTETQLETIRAFLAERDERFADLPRREALDLCRRAREESFEEGDVVRAVGEDDDVVFACVVGAASDWPEEEEERTVATDEENEAGPNIAAKTDANVDPADEASSANAAPVSAPANPVSAPAYPVSAPANPVSARDPRAIRTHVPGARCFGEPPSSRAGPRAWTTVADASSRFLILSPEDCSGTSWEQPELTRRKRVDFLCRLPCFDACTLAELAAIASHLNLREFEPGAALANQGQECPGVFCILAGEVAVERRVDLDAARATEATKAAKAAREASGEAPKALDAIFRDDAQRDAYFDFVTSRVGAARARGASIRDVRLGVVGPFGVVGGADCLDRSPANCFLVASGTKPVRALHLSHANFRRLVVGAAATHFFARCAATQTDDAIRETIRARALEGTERRRARVEATPEGFRLRRFKPPRADHETRRAIAAARAEEAFDRGLADRGIASAFAAAASAAHTADALLERANALPDSPKTFPKTSPGNVAVSRDADPGEDRAPALASFVPRSVDVRRAEIGRRDAAGYASARARGGDAEWPLQRGVYRPAAMTAVGGVRVSGGGYAPSSAMARETKRRVASSNLREALFGVGGELPPPPPRVGVAEARTRATRMVGARWQKYVQFLGDVAAKDAGEFARVDRNIGTESGTGTADIANRAAEARRAAASFAEATHADRLRIVDELRDANAALLRARRDGERRRRGDASHASNASSSKPSSVDAWLGLLPAPSPVDAHAPARLVNLSNAPAGERRRGASGTARDPRRRLDRDAGKRDDADERATTSSSAGSVGATTASDRRAGRGDAAADDGFFCERRDDVVVAVARLVAHDRAPWEMRDELCVVAAEATTETRDGSIRFARWSGDALFFCATRENPDEDSAKSAKRRRRAMVNLAARLRAFVRRWHEHKTKSYARPPPGGWLDPARTRWTPRGISPWASPRARRLWTSRRGGRSERRTANPETPPRDCATSPRRVEGGARRFDRARRVSQDARTRGWDEGGGVRGVPSRGYRQRRTSGTLGRKLRRGRVRGGKRGRARARVRASRPGTRTIRDEEGDGEGGDGEGAGGVSTDGARARRRRERGAGDVSTNDDA